MSIAELKKTADQLSARERRWLKAYLFAQDRSKDPNWQREMAGRRRDLKSGKGIPEAKYRKRLSQVGKE